MYKSSSFVCIAYCTHLLLCMFVNEKDSFVLARLWVDHPFSTINWLSETLRRIPIDELTLLSDNLGRSFLLSYSSAVDSRWRRKLSQ